MSVEDIEINDDCQSYTYEDTVVEIHGELNTLLLAEKLHKLFTKKGINAYE